MIWMLGYQHPLGDGRILHREALLLAQEGFELTVAARTRPGVAVEPGHPRIRLLPLPPLPRSLFGQALLTPFRWLGMFWRVWRRSAKGDVFVAHEHQSTRMAWALARLRGGAWVYDVHEFWPENFAHSVRLMGLPWLSPLARVLLERQERWAWRTADARVFAARASWEEKNFPPARSVFLPNYPTRAEIPWPLPPPPAGEWREKIRGRKVVLFVGNLSPRAGTWQMLETMSRLKAAGCPACFLLVGRINPEHEGPFRDGIRKRGLTEDVLCTGWFDHHRLPEFLALGDIGIHLMRPDPAFYRKAEATKYFQYAAAGLPQVVTDLAAHRRLREIGDNAVLVDCDGGGAAAEAILALLADPAEARRLGDNGRRAYETHWNLDRHLPEWLALYRELRPSP